MARDRSVFAFAICACAAAAGFGALGACASDNDVGPPMAADASLDRVIATPRTGERMPAPTPDAATLDAARVDPGPCNVRIDAVPVVASPHVPDGTPVVYGSNPPSSGAHYNSWANFQELTHPVDDGHLVHSLEHGAVLLLYKCQGTACDALVAALRAVREAIPTDPLCDPAIRTRVILAPRAANDVAVAAAAWSHVYRADCVDAASLTSFVLEHYAKAPENFCVPGQVF